MSRFSYLLIFLSLITSNIYIVDSYTLTESVLIQKGYNNQSTSIDLQDHNIDNIDLNAFNAFNTTFY
jgi:hypothetical protein